MDVGRMRDLRKFLLRLSEDERKKVERTHRSILTTVKESIVMVDDLLGGSTSTSESRDCSEGCGKLTKTGNQGQKYEEGEEGMYIAMIH